MSEQNWNDIQGLNQHWGDIEAFVRSSHRKGGNKSTLLYISIHKGSSTGSKMLFSISKCLTRYSHSIPVEGYVELFYSKAQHAVIIKFSAEFSPQAYKYSHAHPKRIQFPATKFCEKFGITEEGRFHAEEVHIPSIGERNVIVAYLNKKIDK